MSPDRSWGFALSVREVAWGGVLVGLTAAGFFLHRYFANVGILLMMALLAGIAIRVMVLRGASRVFALGFFVPYAMYLAATFVTAWFLGHRLGYFTEYGAFGGILTTTQVMQSWLPPRSSGTTLSGAVISLRALNAQTLMPCGHLLLAFLLGCCGGKYGVAIYNQREDAREKDGPDTPCSQET